MAFVDLDPLGRNALLVCDDCNGVLMPDGKTFSKPHRDSDPSDLASLYRYRSDLVKTAIDAEWEEKGGRWLCSGCKVGP